MEMNKEDEIALEESINKWKSMACGIDMGNKCPLCVLGANRNPSDYCEQCIIKKYTGLPQCHGTPYWPRKITPEYYQWEIEFLESLRPERKVEKGVIEVGDEVTVHDNSWAYILNQGKTENYLDMRGHSYIVIGTRLQLPESSSHEGQLGNDTILYDSINGSYIFTHEEYLKLLKPRHCPECGKAK